MQRNCVVDTYMKLLSYIRLYIIYYNITVLKYLYHRSTIFRCIPILEWNSMLKMDAERKDAYTISSFSLKKLDCEERATTTIPYEHLLKKRNRKMGRDICSALKK